MTSTVAPVARVRSSDGTTIAFDRSGDGPPIILVDGAFCSRAMGPMPKLAALLGTRFTTVHYDRRGRGDSGDTPPYTVEREIDDLAAVIDAAGGSAYVCAMSSGAALALQAAASGVNIPKLALYEPPYLVGDPARQPPADAMRRLTALVAADRRGEAAAFYLRDLIGMPAVAVSVMRLLPMWSKLKAVANTLPYDLAVLGDFSLPTELAASVAMPTLVVGGERSPAALCDAVRSVAQTLPNARLRLLPRQTHNVSVRVLAPVLEEFFAEPRSNPVVAPSTETAT